MILDSILNIAFTVISIIISINVWLTIGYIMIMVFDDLKTEMEFKEVVVMSFSWPITVVMLISKQLKIKRYKK